MKKVLIWGTGNISKQVVKGLVKCEIAGFVETEKTKETYLGYEVFSVTEMPEKYDILLIASIYADAIYQVCKKMKIDERKVCYIKAPAAAIDVAHNLELAGQILDGRMYQQICTESGCVADDWISRDAAVYTGLNRRPSMAISELQNMYIYSDKFAKAGSVSSYFWQDLWAARKIYENRPDMHYDIGSRVDGFISHLLSFRDHICMIDIRPLDREVDGLEFIEADATNLDTIRDGSMESLSALCSLEHFGLGRYGDPVDPEACYKCFAAIGKKLAHGGNLYLSVPVGKEHVEFNAHRVFYASTIVEAFKGCDLIEYSCTKDGYIEYHADLHQYDEDYGLGGNRFGLFHFRKSKEGADS